MSEKDDIPDKIIQGVLDFHVFQEKNGGGQSNFIITETPENDSFEPIYPDNVSLTNPKLDFESGHTGKGHEEFVYEVPQTEQKMKTSAVMMSLGSIDKIERH